MNELKDTKTLPQSRAGGMKSEAAGLNSLLNLINNPAITGAEVPEDAKQSVRVPMPHPNLRKVPAPAMIAPVAPDTAPERAAKSPGSRANLTRIFFTGIICAGKDYVAQQAGAQVLGFADPLYALVNFMFNTSVSATTGKDTPGVRELLQTLGQWGRGEVNPKYPLTPARYLMAQWVRSLNAVLPADLCVNWAEFGLNQDIWLNSLLERVGKIEADRRVAVTNVRFENEFKGLRASGWTHYHIMCSTASRADRLRRANVPANSPALTDVSERLAIGLDADVNKKIKAPGVNKLRVIWNDVVAPPSQRLQTVNQWLQDIAIGALPVVPAEAPALPPAAQMSLE